jgi:hypothetical protein
MQIPNLALVACYFRLSYPLHYHASILKTVNLNQELKIQFELGVVKEKAYWYCGDGPAKQGRRAPTSVAELGGAIRFALIFFVTFLYQDKKVKKEN